jgi:hypothetical protein
LPDQVGLAGRAHQRGLGVVGVRRGAAIRAGSEFGLPGFVRVTTGEQELMETVGARIVAAASA